MIKSATDSSHSAITVLITFLKLGVTSFGGPVAHIGYFRKELVEKQQWLSEDQFSQLLAICQFLPGPASSQLGFALGLLRAGWLGAMAAFVGFTLPSAILLIAFALLVPNLNHELGLTAIHGLKIVACAVVADAVLGMAKKLCPDTQRKAMAIGAAALILVTTSPWIQLMVVVMGGVIGSLLYKQSNTNTSPKSIAPGYGKHVPLISFSLFIALLLGLGIFSHTHIFTSIAHAFYQPGALVFGGGHVVLPLLEESTVATGWVSTESFLAGYGASQAIPGPLFTFAAYLGTVIPTGYAPWVGAIIALLFIFLPGFLLVIAALPLWETVNRNAWMANAVTGVNAAVVGLLAAALYDPIITSGIQTNIDMAIGLVAFGLLVVAKLSPLWVVAWCVFSSMMFSLI